MFLLAHWQLRFSYFSSYLDAFREALPRVWNSFTCDCRAERFVAVGKRVLVKQAAAKAAHARSQCRPLGHKLHTNTKGRR